jgi:eukaryotic-like serine/threonine-protein kinase
VIERELGHGGMATVYLARDLRHDRRVALKVLRPELAATMGPERFAREIRVAAGLSHPHILGVHDSGDAAGRLWFTMPFVEGSSLRDRLRREGQLPVEDAVRVAREAAQGLAYAHAHGVIHRDVKPENLLLTADGGTLVADFGIARALAGEEDRITSTGLVLGTPAYMSPEQAVGDRSVDARSDIYSLGSVLYEMLAGEPPFSGPTVQAVIAKRFAGPPPPLRLLRPGLPAGVVSAVDRALAALPADRFQSMSELARALGAGAVSTASIDASTVELPVPPATLPRRRPLLFALLAGVLLVAGGWLVIRRAGPSPPLDPDLVAVTPFDVPDPRLALWREGLVDLLSRSLDGAGPVRAVPPTVVIRRWQGRADRPSATALGRRTGAGLVVVGSLIAAGPDSARITATAYDVAADRPLAELELRDAADRMDRVADSLTVRLLRELGRTRRIAALGSTSLGSSSLPALKAFLQGEQYFRRLMLDSARASDERALAIDADFPLAMWRLSQVLGWTHSAFDTTSLTLALRAGDLNRGLGVRDSLLIAADSALSALYATVPRLSWTTLRRAQVLGEELTRRYPDDAESWYLLGEARYHWGVPAGYPVAEAVRAFDRAIRCDSSFFPAYIHAIELAFRLDGLEAGRRYAQQYLAQRPTDEAAAGIRLADRIAGAVLAGRDPRSALQGASPSDLHDAQSLLARASDSAEAAVTVSRALVAAPQVDDPSLAPVEREAWLTLVLLYRGHVREAARYASGNASILPVHRIEIALMAALPADSVKDAFQRILLGGRAPALSSSLPWWLAHEDGGALREIVRRGDSLARAGSADVDREMGTYLARSATAYLAVVHHDTTTAIQTLEALPDSLCPVCYTGRLLLGRLLAARHEDHKAEALLDQSLIDLTVPSNTLWVLERGRVAERMGDRAKASRSYQYVADVWRNADPELQPYVAEAKEGLARLTNEAR